MTATRFQTYHTFLAEHQHANYQDYLVTFFRDHRYSGVIKFTKAMEDPSQIGVLSRIFDDLTSVGIFTPSKLINTAIAAIETQEFSKWFYDQIAMAAAFILDQDGSVNPMIRIALTDGVVSLYRSNDCSFDESLIRQNILDLFSQDSEFTTSFRNQILAAFSVALSACLIEQKAFHSRADCRKIYTGQCFDEENLISEYHHVPEAIPALSRALNYEILRSQIAIARVQLSDAASLDGEFHILIESLSIFVSEVDKSLYIVDREGNRQLSNVLSQILTNLLQLKSQLAGSQFEYDLKELDASQLAIEQSTSKLAIQLDEFRMCMPDTAETRVRIQSILCKLPSRYLATMPLPLSTIVIPEPLVDSHSAADHAEQIVGASSIHSNPHVLFAKNDQEHQPAQPVAKPRATLLS